MTQNENPASLIVIFGATGDLANRKLFPSLYNLFSKGNLSKNFAVVGVARRSLTNDEFKQNIIKSVGTVSKDTEKMNEFASHFYYHSHDVTDSASYTELKGIINDLDEHYQTEGNRIFYLAMAPEFFGTIAIHLKDDG